MKASQLTYMYYCSQATRVGMIEDECYEPRNMI